MVAGVVITGLLKQDRPYIQVHFPHILGRGRIPMRRRGPKGIVTLGD